MIVFVRTDDANGAVVAESEAFVDGLTVGQQGVVHFDFSPTLIMEAGRTYVIAWKTPVEGGRNDAR